MNTKIKLTWQELAFAIAHYLYAKYKFPPDGYFTLSPCKGGVRIELIQPDKPIESLGEGVAPPGAHLL